MVKILKNLFSNKTYLVTGSTGYIGSYISNELNLNRVNLILLDQNENKLIDQKKKLKKYSNKIKIYKCDFTNEQERFDVIKKIKIENKVIDCILNNAALVGDSNLKGWNEKLDKQSIDTWNKSLEVNLTSVFHICKELKGLLKRGKNPNIINFSSIYGVIAPDFNLYKSLKINNPAAYSVSKSGLIHLTKWLASSLAPKIRVNSISLGGIKRKQSKIFQKRYNQTTLLKRMCTEEDVMGAVIYLSSDLSKYVTGSNLVLDGGKSII